MKKEKIGLVCKTSNNSIQYAISTKLTGNEKAIQQYCLCKLEEKIKNIKDIKDSDIEYLDLDLSQYMNKLYKDIYDYRQVKRDLESIVGHPITLTKKWNGEEAFYVSSLIQSALGDTSSNLIRLKFDTKLLKEFIGIKEFKKMTNYSIDTYLNLKNNIYAQIMYEYLKSIEGIGETKKDDIYTFSLDLKWLQDHLLEKDKKGEFIKKSYIKNRHLFNIRVVEVFTNIINDYSDLKFIAKGKREKKDKNGNIINEDIFYKIIRDKYEFSVDYRYSDRKESKRKIEILKENYSKENQYEYDKTKKYEINKRKINKKKSNYKFENIEEINLDNIKEFF